MFAKKRRYFDYAATTPIHPAVIKEMQRIFEMKARGELGNPGSMHELGKRSKEILNDSRKKIANLLQVQPSEIIFTGNATEANCLSIFGTVELHKKMGKDYNEMHIVSSNIEHISVQKALDRVKELGVRVSYVESNCDGVVNADDFIKLVNDDTILVTCIYVQSETGVIQPINEIGKKLSSLKRNVVFHTDACQAMKYLNYRPHNFNASLMTLDSLKVCGPSGVGILYKSSEVSLDPVIVGSKQEFGLRAGTECFENIAGLAKAIEISEAEKDSEFKRVSNLTEEFVTLLREKVKDLFIHGERSKRSPNFSYIYVPNVDNEYLAARLDLRGFSFSTASACNDGVALSLKEMYKNNPELPLTGMRITFGILTTKSDVVELVNAVAEESKILINKRSCDTMKA